MRGLVLPRVNLPFVEGVKLEIIEVLDPGPDEVRELGRLLVDLS